MEASANCEAVGSKDAFCPRRGQKRVQPGGLSLANAWRHVADEAFNLDGRILHHGRHVTA